MVNSSTRSVRSLRNFAAALVLGAGALLFSPVAEAHWHGGWGWGWGWHGGWGCCGWGWGWGGPRVNIALGWPGYYGYGPYPYYPPSYPPSYAPPYSYAPPNGYSPSYNGAPPSNYSQSAPPPAQAQSWYRCDNPQGYYPYIQSCSSGWRQVPAAPQGGTYSQQP